MTAREKTAQSVFTKFAKIISTEIVKVHNNSVLKCIVARLRYNPNP